MFPDILGGAISCTCRCAHMQEDLLEMIAHLRLFKLPNFEVRGELALGFRWHINPHVAYKKLCCRATSSTGITFTSVTSLHMVLWKRIVYLHGYVSRLVRDELASLFLKRVPKKQGKC